MTKEDHQKQRDFLLQGAIWQDSLLQSYRSLHIAIQAALLAVGIGLFVASFAAKNSYPFLCFLLLVIFFVLHCLLNRKMQAIVKNRCEDVDYWHRAIIQTERRLPVEQRQFAKFKIAQKIKSGQKEESLNAVFLSEEADRPEYSKDEMEKLLGKGIGHTRRVIDKNLFKGISISWYFLLAATGFGLINQAIF